jgi:hypothetical protein
VLKDNKGEISLYILQVGVKKKKKEKDIDFPTKMMNAVLILIDKCYI